MPRRIFSSIGLDKDVETTVNCTMDIGEETQRAISSLLAKDHVITEHSTMSLTILDETKSGYPTVKSLACRSVKYLTVLPSELNLFSGSLTIAWCYLFFSFSN